MKRTKRNRSLVFIAGISLILFLGTTQSGFAQEVDTEKSTVAFKVSNMLVGSVKGDIKGMSGNVQLAPQGSIQVCIDPASIDTGNKKRDKHLRSEDFFHVEKYPSICFSSSSIKEISEGYSVVGSLELLGIRKEITIILKRDGDEVSGEFEVNRFDFGLGEEAYSGTFMVGETATISIRAVLKD